MTEYKFQRRNPEEWKMRSVETSRKLRQILCTSPHYPAEFNAILQGKESIITVYILSEDGDNSRELALIKASKLSRIKGWHFRYLLDKVDSVSVHSILYSDYL